MGDVHKLTPPSRPIPIRFFRSGDAVRMDVVEKKAPVSEIAVVCGAERGVFELTKFGPGGASRCIRLRTPTGVQYVTPIEFEALGGKERNWKRNIRLAENNKLVQFEIFEAGLVKTCPRSCTCQNCQIAKLHPTNLEKLIDTVYSPVKNGVLPTPESSPEAEKKSQTDSFSTKIGNKDVPLSPVPAPVPHLNQNQRRRNKRTFELSLKIPLHRLQNLK